ncbi:MAG TPA: tetratricopeptide repeat protein, partial [Verrucomicrobiae bacterium]|nr:tetratricopeptide repeat protein [Verrucomicrobiae bacterium]
MTPLTDKRKLLIIALLLALITAAIYLPVLGHDFINYDDPDYVTFNEVVLRGLTGEGLKWAFTTGHASNWHPVTWLSHMLDVQLFGVKPAGHHGTNVALHVANAVLLLLLLWQLTGVIWRSAFVAALFALHPLHVESVAWVAERKDVLSTFFGLLCLLAYGAYARHKSTPHPTLSPDEAERANNKSKVAYALTFTFLALGLMSKAMLVTWPFVMLLLDVWPLKRIELSTFNVQLPTLKRLILEKLPFFALVIGSCVATFLVQQSAGAVTTMENLPLEDRLANAVVSYAKYLFMTIWPADLAIFYPHPELRYPASTQWSGWAITLTLVVLAGISWLAFKRQRELPYLFTGWFWYLGILVPVIGIVQVGTQGLADRYTYVPLIGIFVVIAWGSHLLIERLKMPPFIRPLLGLVALVSCAIISYQQVLVWRDDFTLFGHALKVTTGNAPAHSTLGKAWAKKGDYAKALEHLRAAREAYPHYPNVRYDTGLTLFYMGRYEEAIEEYLAELAHKPDHLMARNNLATAYRFAGKPDEAIEHYRLVLDVQPDHPQSLRGLGSTLMELGRAEEAVTYLNRAVELNPELEGARVELARALAFAGQFDRAQSVLNVAGPEKPAIALLLGEILSKAGKTNEAAEFFQDVVRRFPKIADELLNEGKRQLAAGQLNAALTSFNTAVQLSPNLAEAHQGVGIALAQLGRVDEAVR